MSMYLRTLCDRELYLSLFSNNPVELGKAGLPIPLKSRPGVQLITASGREFEYEQYNILCSSLPNNVFAKSSGTAPVDLFDALSKILKPTLILQPQIEPEKFRDIALTNIGVATEDLKFIPKISGLRPDVIFADGRRDIEFEIRPDGTRRQLVDDDKRMALSVIDLKNITEANASYSAEVCLYAIFVANWLHNEGKAFLDRFFVSDRVYLWRHIEMPNFTKILGTKEGGDHAKRLAALREDLEDGLVHFLIYMPSVRKFFSEDLPRVVQLGDTKGWDAVPYHVNPRCSSCDWLGNRVWLSDDDRKHFDAHKTNYCTPAAESSDHLSKMATLTKGASNVLLAGGHPKVATLVGIKSDAAVLRKHSLLKQDRRQISHRAESIGSGKVSVDGVSKVGGLAKRLGAEFDIVVNFDSGSGLLTGLAIRGALFSPYGKKFPAVEGKKFENSYLTVKMLPNGNDRSAAIQFLRSAISDLSTTKIIPNDVLLGIEGRAAAFYFDAWRGTPIKWNLSRKALIPDDWHNIAGRRSSLRKSNGGARHPINAMLNYGYAVLHAYLKLKLISEGFDPKIGLAHATEKYRDALVLDHMEPLRPVVDQAILRLVLGSTLKAGDFTITREGFCRLNPQLARKIVSETSSVCNALT